MKFKVNGKLPQANMKSSADQIESIMVKINNQNEIVPTTSLRASTFEEVEGLTSAIIVK